MRKERLNDGFKQFHHTKKPVTVESISIRDKHGDVLLTNVTRMPIFDENNEFTGSVLIVNDVSHNAEIQAELKRKQGELERLDQQFKEVHTKFKIMDKERNAFDSDLIKIRENQSRELNNITGMLKEKQQELGVLDKSISLKNDELTGIINKLNENKSTLSFVESEITRKQTELETGQKANETPGNAWRDKLKIYDEIDKSLEVVDDNLKTKKLKEGTDET
jgi:chromosome segregation ATPase